jgi:hypothetical protein
MCQHQPVCPPAQTSEHAAARVVAAHPEQGWSLLCNGVVVFDDTGELLPDGRVVAPHRPDGDHGHHAPRTVPALRPPVSAPVPAPRPASPALAASAA